MGSGALHQDTADRTCYRFGLCFFHHWKPTAFHRAIDHEYARADGDSRPLYSQSLRLHPCLHQPAIQLLRRHLVYARCNCFRMLIHLHVRHEPGEGTLMAILATTSRSNKASQAAQKRIRRAGWTRRNLATAFLLVFLVYFLLPFFWLIVSTTKTNPELFTTFGLWFASDFNFFNNLSDLFTRDNGV